MRGIHTKTVAVIAILCTAVFFPMWRALVSRWYELSQTDSHGFLVVAVSLYFLFRCARGAQQPQKPLTADWRPLALAALLVAALLWESADFANILVAQSMLLPPIMMLALISVFGYSASRTYIFPVLFLYFAMPIWGVLIPLLQQLSISVVSWFIACIRIPALIDGEVVHLPGGSFWIESGCAGLHFLIVGLALSALYGFLYLARLKNRILVMAIAAFLAIVGNWIRISTVVVAGHWSNMQHYLVAVDHYYFGWAVFMVMLVPLYFVAQRLGKSEEDFLEPQRVDTEGTFSVAEWRRRLIVVVGVLCIFPAMSSAIDASSLRNVEAHDRAPSVLGDWIWLEGGSPNWEPMYPGALIEKRGAYRRDDVDIQMYANFYSRQTQGEELIGQLSSLLDPKYTLGYADETVEYINLEQTTRELSRIVRARRMGEKQIVVFWYLVGEHHYVGSIDVKLNELLARVRGKAGSGVVALLMDCRDDCSSEEKILLEFAVKYDNSLGYVAGVPKVERGVRSGV